jgi:hypothetical protein
MDRPYSEYDIFDDGTFGTNGANFFERYRKEKDLWGDLPPDKNEIHLNSISIGDDIAIVTNPCELFCEFGLEIKKSSPFRYTMIAELTNGCCGYVPTKQAFTEGGYEVRKEKGSSHLDINAGDAIVESSIRLLHELKK